MTKISAVRCLTAALSSIPFFAAAAQADGYADKTVAIAMAEQCPQNPDPNGFASDDAYSSCDKTELDALHNWLAKDLHARSLFADIDGPASELTLTIILSKDQRTSGGTLVATNETTAMEAQYSLTDPDGHLVKDGVIDSAGSASASHEDVARALMVKVAAALAGEH